MDTALSYLQQKKVQGALLVGIGLVAGSYVIANFGASRVSNVGPAVVIAAKAPERPFIQVVDSDGDGIEDWRQEFAPKTPIMIAESPADEPAYTPPTTLTGQMSVRFFEQILQSRAGFGPGQEEIVRRTVDQVATAVRDPLYTTRDIRTVPTTPETIREYANAMGSILLINNVPGYDSEMTILERALKTESMEEVQKILPLENAYRNMRDQALRTPVPDRFVRQHLDVLNVYNALFFSLRDMRQIFDDPVLALMRTRRYQDDATGLANALRNLYLVLEPHATLFTPNDPAVALVAFAPNFQ